MATEVVQRVLAYALQEVDGVKITAAALPGNASSQRVLSKVSVG